MQEAKRGIETIRIWIVLDTYIAITEINKGFYVYITQVSHEIRIHKVRIFAEVFLVNLWKKINSSVYEINN